MRKAEPSTAVVAQSINRNVTRSLYRSLLQEARKLDRATVAKVLLPVPRKLQVATGLTAPLYVPNGVKYKDLVTRAFRAHKPGEAGNPVLAFEALNMFRAHSKTVEGLLEIATKEHQTMVKALDDANPDPTQYWAKPILDPIQQQRIQQERMDEELRKKRLASVTAAAAAPSTTASSENATTSSTKSDKIKVGVDIDPNTSPRGAKQEQKIRDVFARSNFAGGGPIKNKADALAKLGTVEPKVGMGLVAHPLSSSHIDRRVILLVETNPQTTTGLVLDMFYTLPLSHGNPMFGPVFWGHEVYNGGYCHVDYTMPPTANVSILHTLPPPCDSNTTSSYNNRFLNWALKNNNKNQSAEQGSNNNSNSNSSPLKHHEKLCKPVIQGNGNDIPTLYYSKVEALNYLSSLVPGQPRSSLRVYWGCMRWSTTQLTSEIKNGHWIPVDVSPKFFAAYPVIRGGNDNSNSGGKSPQQQHHHKQHQAEMMIDTFPTEDMLRESKDLRTKLIGVDVVPPQTFPPDQPVCRRESLWDQIVLALGGEYRSLVGSVNPFVTKQQQAQAAATAAAPNTQHLAEAAQTTTSPPPLDATSGVLESREAASLTGLPDDVDADQHEDVSPDDVEVMMDELEEELAKRTAQEASTNQSNNKDQNTTSTSTTGGNGDGDDKNRGKPPGPPSV